jgi:hypothetical protein
MMPNLGQGGCQAIEDACVLGEELEKITFRSDVDGALKKYRGRRNARSAAVQGLSRLASDIIIQVSATPWSLGRAYPCFALLSIPLHSRCPTSTQLLQAPIILYPGELRARVPRTSLHCTSTHIHRPVPSVPLLPPVPTRLRFHSAASPPISLFR